MSQAKIKPFEAASLAVSKLQVKRLASNLEETIEEYTLVMDFNAIAQAQQHTGRDLADIRNWGGLTGVDLSTICWCAFHRFHPEVTLEQVREMLSPAQTAAVFNLLIELCHPGVLERLQAAVKEKEADHDGAPPTANPTDAGKP